MKKILPNSIIQNPTNLQKGSVTDQIEDRSSYIRSDDVVTWSGSQLSFISDIILEIINTSNGIVTQHIVQVANSPISLGNLESAWVEIDRSQVSENLTVNLSVGTPIPAHGAGNKDIFVLFRRVDNVNGNFLHIPLHKQVIEQGTSVVLGSSGGGSGFNVDNILVDFNDGSVITDSDGNVVLT
jgi:hypothetical protein